MGREQCAAEPQRASADGRMGEGAKCLDERERDEEAALRPGQGPSA